MEKNFVFRKVN